MAQKPIISSNPFQGLDIGSAKHLLIQTLEKAGLEFSHDDARDLIVAATSLSDTDLIIKSKEPLPEQAAQILVSYTAKRISGEPVDHILGWREFYGRRFNIHKDVLSPRGDTEILVEQALELLKTIARPQVLDLGTGSGAILITLLLECPEAEGLGVDISEAALMTARANASALNVQADWYAGNWFSALPRPALFDVIVSNPPYITSKAMTELPNDVSGYDPELSLHGGDDGLTAYKNILKDAQTWLKAHGWIAVEIGYDQGASVLELFKASGFINVALSQDLAGQDRVIVGQKQP